MATAVTTTVTELPESRVNVDVEVPATEVQRSIETQARKLGREMKVPGFRTGKIPPTVVIQRIGRQPILDEAVRDRLTDWYLKAVQDSGIAPVGDPQVDLADLPDEGKPLQFSFEVGVRPAAVLGAYRGLEVPRREAVADPDLVQEQIEGMRERFGRLEVVDRPSEQHDFVTIDYLGTIDGEPFEGGEGRDQLVEVGVGNLIGGFEEAIFGVSAGEEHTVDATFPDDYGAKHVAGKPAQFTFTVKEVKYKELPEIDDDFAADAAGYDTLQELRDSIAGELVEHDAKQVESEFRAAVLDAVVAGATVDVPAPLVEARAQELLDRMMHSLSHQGVSKEHYLAISGKSEEELVEESRPDAEQALLREAVLAAIIEAESIEPTEEQLLDALETAAEREQTSRKKLLDRLRQAGRVETLAKEVAAEQAIDLVVSTAKPIAPGDAKSKPAPKAKAKAKATPADASEAKSKPAAKRKPAAKKKPAPVKDDELWTPDKEGAAASGKGELWTPDG
ncbi:MAG: trigger factor [Solirubrobacteraceae bacterium]